MGPLALIHITAAYSNAVLVAILPHVSDCAKRLDLPISTPVMIEQVAQFQPPLETNEFKVAAWLTNGDVFFFSYDNAMTFRSPDNWFYLQSFENAKDFVGKDNITTNDAIDFARSTFEKLGYKTSDFQMDNPPTSLELAGDSKKLGHIPYCRVEWDSPQGTTNVADYHMIQFDIDMQRKKIVGIALICTKFGGTPPQIDVVPELESDYRKRNQGHMFFRTNAPSSLSNRTTSGHEEPTVR